MRGCLADCKRRPCLDPEHNGMARPSVPSTCKQEFFGRIGKSEPLFCIRLRSSTSIERSNALATDGLVASLGAFLTG